MKTKRQIISLLLTVCLVAGLMPMSAIPAFAEGTDKTIMPGASQIAGAQHESIYFGTYMQSSASSKDPIKWRVLQNADNKLFLLSDQNLDVFQYHTDRESVTWERSTMRSWLNGYGASENNGGASGTDYTSDNFLDTAFAAKEQDAIHTTEVVNDDNPTYGTEGGNPTQDKMFLLSLGEAKNPAYGFTDSDGSTDTRVATNTVYVADGGKIQGNMYGVGAADYWWLRSPGLHGDAAANVYSYGALDHIGFIVDDIDDAVRPAFNLNLNSVLFTSAAEGGKISSAEGGDGAIFEIPGYTGTEWKATVLDSSRTFEASTTAKKDNVLTVSYSGAETGANEYISVLIADASGAYTHYGRLKGVGDSATGTVDIDLSGIDMTDKTLYVFNEQYNGGAKDDTKLTDYASALQKVATEQFTVTFDVNGHGTVPTAVTVWDGDKLTAPTAPTETGYVFDGWYKESECLNVWDFANDTVAAGTTLYAKWLIDISNATIDPIASQTYKGEAITPDLTVKYGNDTLVKDTDYSVLCTENINAGTAAVKVTGIGKYGGEITTTFTIAPREVTITWGNTEFTYDGSAKVPTATAGNLVGTDSCNITVEGAQTNAGSGYTATAVRVDNYNYKLPANATASVEYAIAPAAITEGMVAVDPSSVEYSGAEITPTVTVKNGTTTLFKDTDYTVSGSTGGTDANTYTITVMGIGNYTGEVTKQWKITNATMTGISAQNITAEYDGQGHSIEVTGAPAGATVTYSTDGTNYSETNPVIKNVADSKTVYYKVSLKNYNDYTGSATVTVKPREITVVAVDASKTYGDNDPTLTYKVDENTPLVSGESLTDIDVDRESGEDAKTYTITASQPEGANPNYEITFVNGTFTINQKELEIVWGDTEFTYDGSAKVPTATADNLVGTDVCNIIVDGAQTNAGEYVATATSVDNGNYKLPANATTIFKIKNASQEKPSLTKVDETIKGKGNGKINGLAVTMEISTDGTSYTAVSGADIGKGYAAGTYYVRYAAKQNYNASEPTMITIGAGRMLTVTLPQEQMGYTLTADRTELAWRENVTLSFSLKDGYSKLDTFAVKIGGQPVSLSEDGTFTCESVEEDITIAVDGVADITAPDATMSVKGVGWKQFIHKITFGLFFKENVAVEVEASDLGSGIAKVEYLIAETAFTTEDAVKTDNSAWNTLTLENGKATFHVTEQGKNYVYLRVTDKAGNIKVVSSDGGVVIYTDSTQNTGAISFTKTTTDDVSAKVNLNGNTVKAIYNDTLVDSKHYSVATDGTITFKASYLDTLAAGQYTLHIAYHPQGEAFVESDINDAPAETKITLTVSKQAGTVRITNDISKTYDGTAVTAPTYDRNNADGKVVVEYKVKGAEDTTYSAEAPKNAGDYTVRVTVKADTAGFYTEAVAEDDFTIAKKALKVTAEDKTAAYGDAAPAYTVQYDGFVSGEDESVLGGTLGFDCDYVQFSDIGEYDIRPYGLTAENYHFSYNPGKLTVSPKKITVTVESATSIYGNPIAELKATDNGIVNNDKDVYSLSTTAASTSDVGKYSIKGTALDDNYAITFANETDAYEITQRELTVAVTVADKKYDGLNTAVITSAVLNNVANGDQIVLTNGTATFESVNAANGISIVFTDFAISGDKAGNYTLKQPTGVTASITNGWNPIADTEYTVSVPNGNGWLNADFLVTAKDGYKVSLTNTANGDWGDTLIGSVEGADSSIQFYVKNIADGTISEMTTAGYKLDKGNPTGKVSFDERNGWEGFLNTISFGLFYKDEVTVKAEASDALSGVGKIEYIESATAMSLAELKAATGWTEMPKSGVGVTVEDAKQFVYYVRITDQAGNVTYLSTDGAEYDTTAPVISGIENGKTYYTTQKVTVTDKNIASVTLNGEPAAADITLDGNVDKTYTITATDKAGNETTVTVTMKPIASIAEPIDEITEDNVKSSDKETIEGVIAQVEELLKDEDLTEDEKAALEEIRTEAGRLIEKIEEVTEATETENTEKVEDITSENVTPEDKGDLEKAKDDLEKALEEHGDNMTEEEKKAVQDEIDRMDEALEVIGNVEKVEELIGKLPGTITKNDADAVKAADDAYNALSDYEKSLVDKDAKKKLDDAKAALAELNKPTDTDSPQTGDNSHMALWIALLFVSGGAVVTLTVTGRKKRTAKR